MYPNVQLSDGVLLLRPPCSADLPLVTAAVLESLPELHPWMDWATPGYNADATSHWLTFAQLAWEHSTAFPFVVFDSQTDEYLGNCSLDGIDEKQRRGNLGYWVRSARTGQGLAARAIRLVGRFACESLGLRRVEILIAAENTASRRAAEKAGAHYEKALPNPLVVRTDVYDAVLYSLTPADFGL